MERLYHDLSYRVSQLVTTRYSTSFSIGTRCLSREIRPAIYAVYGFVRLADEIVDSFHEHDRATLLGELESEYDLALRRGISINPVINAFTDTVTRYGIDRELVESFLGSMKMDLLKDHYDQEKLERYIYGSAEVVGLMCLRIFVKGDRARYEQLAPYAVRLGAAFQKVNFLRDIREDVSNLDRVYFPALNNQPIDEKSKKRILSDIYDDFKVAEKGIRDLPECARLGVYTAYLYYLTLTKAIEKTPAENLMEKRVRISNRKKAMLLGKACLSYKFI